MRLIKKIFALGFLVISSSIVFIGFYIGIFAFSAAQPSLSNPSSLPSTEAPGDQIISIHKGSTSKEISKLLESKGIITSSQRFYWLGKFASFWKKIKTGEYQVSPGMTPIEIFSTLTSGISISHPITIREGENMYEVASDIESKGLGTKINFLNLCKSPDFIKTLGFKGFTPSNLEGYLFPDTYNFNRAQNTEEMIRNMVKRFHSFWTAERERKREESGLTRHQIITLASMIEKETGATQERPLISSVFYNRLRKKMRLQSDPTTIYGIWSRYRGNLHKSDLLEETPYNTYTISGLPLGPIGNPGLEAIDAALNPAQTDFLYFVSHNDGTHQFSRSLEEHNEAVRRFQLDPNAKVGKSWRDLRKISNAK